MRLLPLLLLLACTGGTKDDTGVEPADTDTDTDTDADTDADPRDASISGMVIFEDGSPAPFMEVQVCSTVCRYAETDAAGNFSQGGLEAARFKVDAIGATYTTPGYGNSLVGVDLAVSEELTLPAPMVVPPAAGPVVANETAAEQTYNTGDVSLTFAGTDIELPNFVAEDNGDFALYAGVLEGTELTPLWTPLTPSFVVALLPWGTEVLAASEGMDIVVTGLSSPDGTYDVYALEEYGEPEGPLGTATVTGGTATATGIKPQVWTWLMFVPA